MAKKLEQNSSPSFDILEHITADDKDDEKITDQSDVEDDDDDADADADDDDPDNEDEANQDDDGSDDDDDEEEKAPEPKKPITEDVEVEQALKGYRADAKGNLLDEKGQIIFPAGKSRGIFTKIKNALNTEKQAHRNLQQEHARILQAGQQLLQNYKALKEQAELSNKHGLSDTEMREAIETRALMKLDPKRAVQAILTKLHLGGTDLKDIGVTQPLDTRTLAEHVAQLIAAKQPDPEAEARQEAEAFFKRHPSAKQYESYIAEAKGRFPHMTPDEIWFQLQMGMMRANQNARNQKSTQQRTGNNPNRTIPRNNHRDDSHRTAPRGLSVDAVDPSQSYSQIGRDLLRDIRAMEKGNR